ncbi:SusC/RagA family TonB-linked outer membrane protein [Sphingobacterium daejeonense]|uniref:SusC/RagA family TonB-linked outer membrane protein n=1 Tax=Sphingobacterium daejeonense TaxID=371142 RepID=UPI001E41784E|nr:TonB-dependent receptor [Sphingobacterium daejeonense]
MLRGRVMDSSTGTPIAGASLAITGTQQKAQTNENGEFNIALSGSNPSIEISYIGYESQIVRVNSQSFLEILLVSAQESLDEVVVTGYQTERKKDLTGSVSVVNVSEIMKSAENNPMKAMQGRVAGMTVTADGNPSGAATVRMRGIGSINSSQDPLYVIDGVPSQGGMHELNSNDIESIQVLRDASSASIYGSRAANGVIVVTTKKGKLGAPKLTFDSYLTSTYFNNQMEVLNAREYGQALWRANVNGGANPNSNNIGYYFDWGYDSNGLPQLNNTYLSKYLDSERTMYASDTDWFDEISKTGLIQSYNASLSSATDKGSSFFSLGYLNNDGTLKHTNFNRISARMNTDYKLFDGKLVVGENFTLNKTGEVQVPGDVLDLSLKALPMIPVHTIDGEGWGGPAQGMNDRHNPMRLLYDNRNNAYNYWRLFGNVYADVQIIEGLHIRSSYGVDYGNFYKRNMEVSYQSGFLNNNRTGVNMEQAHWMKWTWSNTANYRKTIDKHTFDILGGIEMNRQNDITFNAYTSGEGAFAIETPEYMWPGVSTGTAAVGGGATGFSLLSYFGKLNYSYNDRYLASFTVRHDGSSRFGKNNRFATFPAVTAGWRVSEENFMENTKGFISDLKLRVGWGQTGNQGIDNLATYGLFVPEYGVGDPTWVIIDGTAYDISGGGTGSLPSGYRKIQTENDDLKWETTTQTNIGLDFELFGRNLYGSFDWYVKETKDMLINPAYIGVVGEGGYRWANGASMENKGFDITAGFKNNTSFGLDYDITGVFSTYKNKVTHLPEAVENSYGGRAGDNIVGRPLGSFYGYVTDGIFQNQDEVDAHVNQTGKGIGRLRYVNVNDSDSEINDLDRTWIGTPHPDFSYSLNIALKYSAFDLSVYFQGVQGLDVENWLKKQTDFWSVDDVNSNKGTRLLDAWTPQNTSSTIPALQTTNSNDEGRFSTYYIENGSYMKLRNISFGYTLPSDMVSRWKMSRLRFYVSGQNLFTVKSKNFTGVDPENVGWGYPIPTTWTAGLNVSF